MGKCDAGENLQRLGQLRGRLLLLGGVHKQKIDLGDGNEDDQRFEWLTRPVI